MNGGQKFFLHGSDENQWKLQSSVRCRFSAGKACDWDNLMGYGFGQAHLQGNGKRERGQ
jgi:hypothetical protein